MQSRKTLLSATAALLCFAVCASAANVVTIDENGHGNVNGTTLPYQMGVDPSSAHVKGQTNVLIYQQLPFAGVAGDIEIFVGQTPGDVIRFNADNTIIFYAAPGADGNGNSLATQFTPPVPPFPVPNTVQLKFSGEIMTYTPTAGQPGYDASGPTYVFLFTSSTSPASIVNPAGSNLEDAFQVNYVSNLNLGDGVVNVTSAGSSAGSIGPNSASNLAGQLCVNVYVYQPNQQLLACCSCNVDANGVNSWPVIFGSGALLANSGTKPNSVMIKLVATTPASGSTPGNVVCDPTFKNAPYTLTAGMTAWGTHSHPTNTSTVAITETPFKPKPLSSGEAQKLQSDCSSLGTGGRCPGCLTGGLAQPAAALKPSL